MTDELTVNIEPDPPGYRPAKKRPAIKVTGALTEKPVAKKKAAPKKKAPAKKPARKKAVPKKSGKPGKSSKVSRVAPVTPVRSAIASAGKAKKPGKSSTPAKRIGKKPTPESGAVDLDISALKPDPLYGLTRVNQPQKGNTGWWLRIGPKDSRTEQFFADKKNGGEAKAKKLAQARRDELYATLPDKLKRRGACKRKAAA